MSTEESRLALVVLVVGTLSCSDGKNHVRDGGAFDVGPLPDGISTVGLLDVTASAGQCAVEMYAQFLPLAANLHERVKGFAATPTDEARLAAQTAWRQTLALWQQLELFRFGPAANQAQPGGKSVRDRIYAWPGTSRCLVELALVQNVYKTPQIETRPALRGLGALETLLFTGGAKEVGCPMAEVAFHEQWTRLGEVELDRRRAEYAVLVSAGLLADATTLASDWSPSGGNFLANLQSPKGGIYKSLQASLNAVSDGLVYIERATLDMKVKPPLKLDDCMSCETLFESPLAKASKNNILNNLIGFKRLFSGCGPDGAGIGFEDLLWSKGAGATASSVSQALTESFAALEALQSPTLEDAIDAAISAVRVLGEKLERLSHLLTTELLPTLHLKPPTDIAGDNDS